MKIKSLATVIFVGVLATIASAQSAGGRVTISYDKFEDKTKLTLLMSVINSDIMVAFQREFRGHKLKNANPGMVMFLYRRAGGLKFESGCEVIILIHNHRHKLLRTESNLRIVGKGNDVIKGYTDAAWVGLSLTTEYEFLYAKTVDVRVCNAPDFSLSKQQIGRIQRFLSRYPLFDIL
jgi:hypothetical protein